MAEILGVQTINSIWAVETDIDPSLSGGVNAPVGSFGSAIDGSGFFTKTGVLATDWIKVPTLNQIQDSIISSYVVGANTPISNTDTIYSAFGKTQGQINALSTSSHPAVTIGTANGLSIVALTQVLSLALSSALSTGALSDTDWNTFNDKQDALGYTPVNKAGDNGIGLLTFSNNQGIDVDLSGGTDTLNIGTANADIINIGRSGANINIMGNTFYQNVTELQVKDKLFTVNKGGSIGSGANAGFEIEEGGTITGWFDTSGTRDGWEFKAPAAFQMTLSLAALTATRVLSAPDLSGIIATIDGGQTFTSATWNATTIAAQYGGTGQSLYVVGDILYASTTTALSRLEDVATGNALISGGVGVAPSYGKIGLTTHVSGTLGVGNGGTGTATEFTTGSIVFAGASGVYSQDNANLFWDDANNRLGIGSAAPTAFADIAASTTAAASLRMRAGVAPTIPNNGDVWFDGDKFSAFRTTTYNLVGCVFSNTANSTTISNTTTETSFSLSYTFPANSLNVVGKKIRIKGWGTFGNTGTPTITTRLKNGATTLLATPAITMGTSTAQGFMMEAIITIRSIGAGGTISRNLNVSFNDTGATTERMSIVASNGTTAFNTTVSNTITFSVQWSVANAANTITMENMTYEILN